MSIPCSLLLILLCGLSLHAEEPARKDVNGEPLPVGAVARLGSGRFRHPDTITALAYSPDGKLLFAAGPDKVIRVWDVASARVARTLKGHTEEVRGLAVTPEGKQLVSTGLDHSLRLWDLKEFKVVEERERHHEDGTEALAISGDGRLIATACRDNRIGLWMPGGTLHTLSGHETTVLCVAFSPDGRTLASGAVDRTVRLWDVSA